LILKISIYIAIEIELIRARISNNDYNFKFDTHCIYSVNLHIHYIVLEHIGKEEIAITRLTSKCVELKDQMYNMLKDDLK
jgi:hypothetical protein